MKKGFLVAALFAAVTMANAQDASKQEAIYGVKSGIITMSMDMMGNTITTETYFDDYGRKQANVSDFGGQKSRSIVVDGETIMINDAEKTAIRMPAMMGGGMMGGSSVNFMKLTDEVKKNNNIKELGEETIAGKTCKKYSMTVSMMGQSQEQTVWVYQGITLKSSSNSDFGAMERTASKFEENATIPASMFEVPEGVTIQEMNMMMGGGF